MNQIKPISSFKAIYLIDLSPSLCAVAQERFRRCGWKNVHVLCIDALDFNLPKTISSADLITMSYSLSMIPSYYSVIDKYATMLSTKNGLFGVVDFYAQSGDAVASKSTSLGGHLLRHVNWFSRTFWRLWFEFDHVYLDGARRDYLEYRFGTIKSLNLRNKGLGNIPFYVFIGCDKDYSAELERRMDLVATESPYLGPAALADRNERSAADTQATLRSKGYEAAVINMERNLPYPSFFYQREQWRIFYDFALPKYHQFGNQYIYAFTWEDPAEDIKILNLQEKDTVLAITSAGDNILAYAAMGSGKAPRRIHGVDLNPHQNHLAELKLAAFRALPYNDVWKLFGEGKHPEFMSLLVNKLAPHLSSQALQFWVHAGPKTFEAGRKNGLYDTGSTRWALRLTRFVVKLFGIEKDIRALCNSKTIAEQKKIWTTRIRPALFNPIVTRILVANPVFLWKALGVPLNQASMIEGGILRYIIDTIEPLIDRCLISSENYFYYLCLMGHYSRENCPAYITRRGYDNLSSKTALSGIRLHTDTICEVVERLNPGSVTAAIVMDHMDWFPADADASVCDALAEIRALHKALAYGGKVLLRSSSQKPWYLRLYEQEGFECSAAAVRKSGQSIDRVNMYASTWVCVKTGSPSPVPGKSKRGSITELQI